MNSERDTIVDFIEWLDDKHLILLCDCSDYENSTLHSSRFEQLIEEWGNDIETNL